MEIIDGDLIIAFQLLFNIGGFKNICTKLLKGINSLYQHIDFFSLTGHRKGEFFNIEYQIK